MDKIINFFSRLYSFLVFDIWKITENELTRTRKLLYKAIKTIIIAIRGYIDDRLSIKASALTYSILFSAVPVIALIISVSKGFGVEKLIREFLENSFLGTTGYVPEIMGFVEKYLNTMSGGLFVGVGILVLLWSVLSFFMQLETSFNEIWQVKTSRSIFRQFTIYFSAVVLLPALVAFSSGFSIFIKTQLSSSFLYSVFSPITSFFVKLIPFVLNWTVFTLLYKMIPNTKVKFMNALIAGFFAGAVFLVFQNLYISGQINLTRYNAIYGGFAAIPLLLFFIYISCLIVLLGAEISYASQNIHFFDFETDTKNISLRYKNFIIIFTTWLIVKRFEKGEPPLSNDEIAQNYGLPVRLVNQILMQLSDSKVIVEISNEKTRLHTYQPAFDINHLTINVLFDKLETKGSELFLNNRHALLAQFWEKVSEIRKTKNENFGEILIKDL
jgi:membrane protein